MHGAHRKHNLAVEVEVVQLNTIVGTWTEEALLEVHLLVRSGCDHFRSNQPLSKAEIWDSHSLKPIDRYDKLWSQ